MEDGLQLAHNNSCTAESSDVCRGAAAGSEQGAQSSFPVNILVKMEIIIYFIELNYPPSCPHPAPHLMNVSLTPEAMPNAEQ